MRNLVFCPVGSPLTFDDRFDKENHWRYTKPHRLYETFVVQYGSFVPEGGTYDALTQQRGFKWNLARDLLDKIGYQKYEYIAFLDDDLITDIDNLNRAFTLAKEKNLKAFQLSVTDDSDVFYPILRNNSDYKYTKTNFIEVMGPVIHTSLIPLCMELWNKYDIYSGWGFDKILCDLIKEDAAVIHCSQMFHPKKYSSYDKSAAFAEMDKLLFDVFPKFMKEKYNEDWTFKESQIEKEIYMENV